MKFCVQCGDSIVFVVPEGDNRERYVCSSCEFIHYQNPNVVVGTIPVYHDGGKPKIMLCRRGIEPRLGYWTLPAGFLENDESMQQGALRETIEEACAEVVNLELYRILNVVRSNQIHIFFRADLPKAEYSVTPESTEIELFDFDAIPWSQLSFPTVYRTLKDYIRDYPSGGFNMQLGDIDGSEWQMLDH